MLENAERITKRSLRLGHIAIALGGLAIIISIIPFTKQIEVCLDTSKHRNLTTCLCYRLMELESSNSIIFYLM